MLSGEKFLPYSVERKVMNQSRNTKLGFVRDMGDIARKAGGRVFASLGLPAVDIIHRGETATLASEFPDLQFDTVEPVVAQLRQNRVGTFSDSLKRVRLGEVRVFSCAEAPIIGAEVNDVVGIITEERHELGKRLSDIVDAQVSLPDRELFVVLGKVDDWDDDGVRAVCDFANENIPTWIDLYDVHAKPSARVNRT
jgi:hypothetical protein